MFLLLKWYIVMMETRVCSKCNIPQDVEQFSFANKTKGQRRGECKPCERASRKKQRIIHADKIKAGKKLFYQKNKDKLKEDVKQYYLDHKDARNAYLSRYHKKRTQSDPAFRLRKIVSRAVGAAMKRNNSQKKGSCLRQLVYSIEELKQHIEGQFDLWMNWDNQGIFDPQTWDDSDSSTWTWQLDHIVPQSDLPYASMEDDNFQKCWALSNLRPYSAKQNFLDGVRRTRHQT